MAKKENTQHRIMIIDDDVDTLLTFKQILEGDGFRVDVFEDPLLAMSAFRASKEDYYRLLLIDIRYEPYDINVFNGFTIYKKMREFRNKMPPVCFVTSFQNFYDMLRQSTTEVEVHCFIKKPIEGRDLIAKLRQEIG